MALRLDQLRKQVASESEIKAKKYEALMVQVWELLPNFCQSNSNQLSSAFAAIIQYLEPMINENLFGLRQLALRSYSTLINHCRTTPSVTQEIKTTRLGLQRISADYVEGLKRLYLSASTEQGDRNQILSTLQDFASIAKSVKMSNDFLKAFADLHMRFTPNPNNGIRLV